MMDKKNLRIIFMGTPEFAVGTLQALVEGGYNIVAVVTQPDKPVGRHGSILREPDVKVYAKQHGIPVLQPEKMKDETFLQQLRSFRADLQVVVAFRMLPEVVWSMPRFGTFNVHAALLPQYRGAAPINWAIINGEKVTGVTTFFLDHNIDTGRIILQKQFEIPDDADVEYVYNGLMALGAGIALETVDLIIETDGKVDAMSQCDMLPSEGEELHNAPKLFKDNCRIDWQRPVVEVHNFIRGLSPIPGAWSEIILLDDKVLEMKFYKAKPTELSSEGYVPGSFVKEKKHCYVACRDSLLELLVVQPVGKKRMDANAFANGVSGFNR